MDSPKSETDSRPSLLGLIGKVLTVNTGLAAAAQAITIPFERARIIWQTDMVATGYASAIQLDRPDGQQGPINLRQTITPQASADVDWRSVLRQQRNQPGKPISPTSTSTSPTTSTNRNPQPQTPPRPSGPSSTKRSFTTLNNTYSSHIKQSWGQSGTVGSQPCSTPNRHFYSTTHHPRQAFTSTTPLASLASGYSYHHAPNVLGLHSPLLPEHEPFAHRRYASMKEVFEHMIQKDPSKTNNNNNNNNNTNHPNSSATIVPNRIPSTNPSSTTATTPSTPTIPQFNLRGLYGNGSMLLMLNAVSAQLTGVGYLMPLMFSTYTRDLIPDHEFRMVTAHIASTAQVSFALHPLSLLSTRVVAGRDVPPGSPGAQSMLAIREAVAASIKAVGNTATITDLSALHQNEKATRQFMNMKQPKVTTTTTPSTNTSTNTKASSEALGSSLQSVIKDAQARQKAKQWEALKDLVKSELNIKSKITNLITKFKSEGSWMDRVSTNKDLYSLHLQRLGAQYGTKSLFRGMSLSAGAASVYAGVYIPSYFTIRDVIAPLLPIRSHIDGKWNWSTTITTDPDKATAIAPLLREIATKGDTSLPITNNINHNIHMNGGLGDVDTQEEIIKAKDDALLAYQMKSSIGQQAQQQPSLIDINTSNHANTQTTNNITRDMNKGEDVKVKENGLLSSISTAFTEKEVFLGLTATELGRVIVPPMVASLVAQTVVYPISTLKNLVSVSGDIGYHRLPGAFPLHNAYLLLKQFKNRGQLSQLYRGYWVVPYVRLPLQLATFFLAAKGVREVWPAEVAIPNIRHHMQLHYLGHP